MNKLIVFLKYPQSGDPGPETGPASGIGGHGASGADRAATEHVIRQVRRAMGRISLKTEIRFSGGTRRLVAGWLGRDLAIAPQVRGDLGLKINSAMKQAFDAGAGKVGAISADFPSITADILVQAFKALDSTDVVLGAGTNGGLYAIGLKKPAPRLIREIPWTGIRAFSFILAKSRKARLDPFLLPALPPIEKDTDFLSIERAQAFPRPGRSPRISVVIPALKTDRRILPAVKSAVAGGNVEVILACNCEPNRTTDTATRMGASVVFCRRSRACLMNKGAGIATGSILLFLYADTILPANFDDVVREILADPLVALGAFRIRIDSPARKLRLIERIANWRSHRLRLPYGDQALFLSADRFESLGGFPDWPLMEDLAAVQALRRKGKVVIARASVLVPSERWRKYGVLRAALLNQVALAGYAVGVSTERLARLYYRAPPSRRGSLPKLKPSGRKGGDVPPADGLWDF